VPGPLTFRGYYSAIYRTASRIVHGQVEVLDRHMRWSGNQVIVSLDEHAVSDEGVPPLVVPMTTFALLDTTTSSAGQMRKWSDRSTTLSCRRPEQGFRLLTRGTASHYPEPPLRYLFGPISVGD
jgi:hypothetical protein